MLRAAIKNKEIEVGHDIADEEIVRLIHGMVKQRRDSIEAFEKGGRQDLVDREAREIGTLEAYLPPAASDADGEGAGQEDIAPTGAAGPKDMGAVMKEAMNRLGGSADGKRVNEAARR